MLKKISIMILVAVSAFAMHTGELNINNKDLEIGARFDLGQFKDTVEPETTFVGGKFLNAHQDHSDKNSSLEVYGEVNFLMMREVGNRGMKIGMGVKLNATKNQNLDYASLPLGVEFTYKFPIPDLVPMYLNGSFYYAPQVLSFRDANNYLEYRNSYDIELIPNGRITLGYRTMNTNYNNAAIGNFKYNSSAFFGYKISF